MKQITIDRREALKFLVTAQYGWQTEYRLRKMIKGLEKYGFRVKLDGDKVVCYVNDSSKSECSTVNELVGFINGFISGIEVKLR